MRGTTRERILIVDDDPAARGLLGRALSDAGWVVQCVPDAAAAMRALARTSFAAAIVDLVLPGAKGAELIAALAKEQPELALIVATLADNTPAAVSCLRAGVYDYLIKPFDIEDAALRVERALERRQLIAEGRRHEQQLAAALRREARNARKVLLGAINSLSSALEAKDDYTKGHSERVSAIAVAIGSAVGLGLQDLRRVRLAGRLHDIGKIGVRESVLLKPGALTEDEYRQVKVHPVMGERILAPVLLDAETVRIVRHHHEHYAGGGYPDNLRGSDIPLGSRVLAVADAFDALTSDRPYRARLSADDALGVLRTGVAQQWQPTLVDALAQRLETAWPIVWRSRDREKAKAGEGPEHAGQDGSPDYQHGEAQHERAEAVRGARHRPDRRGSAGARGGDDRSTARRGEPGGNRDGLRSAG